MFSLSVLSVLYGESAGYIRMLFGIGSGAGSCLPVSRLKQRSERDGVTILIARNFDSDNAIGRNSDDLHVRAFRDARLQPNAGVVALARSALLNSLTATAEYAE